jgi:tetratricopeptide (TPR) repeat protein
MTRPVPIRAFLILLACVLPLILPAQTPAPGPAVTTDQGLAALQAHQPAQALADFQQVLQADPNNAVATLYAATAALEQYNGPLAVQYAEKARQLDPQSWKVHTTLVAAYASAGMTKQREDERNELAQLHATGAPDARKASGFLLEMFQLGSYQAEAIEYFEPMGKFHTYYRFLVHDPAANTTREIDVQSNDFDEKSWEQTHASQAAAGERHFQLTDASGSTLYRSFSGKPDYDQFRAMVAAIVQSHPSK